MNGLYEITVKAGEDIREAITHAVLDHGWHDVLIPCAIGSVIDMVFTTPIRNELPLQTASVPCNGAAELLSFTGEIMSRDRMDPALEDVYPDKDSPLFVHLHASCATAGGHVMGGGMKSGRAFRAVRVFMLPLDTNDSAAYERCDKMVDESFAADPVPERAP